MPALAEGFGDRPITLLVGFPAGGSNDMAARIIAPHLGRELGTTVVVEIKAGASGTIAAMATVKAPPDGHTLFASSMSAIVVEGDEARFDETLTDAAESLRRQTPASRRARLCGKLDMLGVSRRVMGLYLEDGTPVTALWNAEDFTGLAEHLGKDVTIEGMAMFRPSGKLLRIDADAIAAAGVKDSFFSKLPMAETSLEVAAKLRGRPGESAYATLRGCIPAEESDEEFMRALEAFE